MRDIPGHEGRYSINEDGTKVWSYPKPKKMMQGCIGWTKGKFLSINTVNRGYKHVTLSVKDERGRRPASYPVHRLVAFAFIGLPISPDLQVNHKDKNTSNNHYKNLEWVTKQENVTHSWENGRAIPRKLSIENIKKIRELLEEKIPKKRIAKILNIHPDSVRWISKKNGIYALSNEEIEERIKNAQIIKNRK